MEDGRNGMEGGGRAGDDGKGEKNSSKDNLCRCRAKQANVAKKKKTCKMDGPKGIEEDSIELAGDGFGESTLGGRRHNNKKKMPFPCTKSSETSISSMVAFAAKPLKIVLLRAMAKNDPDDWIARKLANRRAATL